MAQLTSSRVWVLALLAWLWLILALPFVTDASCNMFVGFVLAASWMLLAAIWLIQVFISAAVRGSWSGRSWWMASGFAIWLGILFAWTDVGLIIRIKFCESSLASYASQVPPEGGQSGHNPQLVGLFLVDGEENREGIVFLYTSRAFINREGVAYVPEGVTPKERVSRRRLHHLYGPWYWFSWKF
jgi:hypothetical protein